MHDSESVIQGHPWYKVLPHCVWWTFSIVTSILILLRQCSSVITMWSITDPRSSVTQHHPVKQRHLRFWGRIFLRGTFLTPRYLSRCEKCAAGKYKHWDFGLIWICTEEVSGFGRFRGCSILSWFNHTTVWEMSNREVCAHGGVNVYFLLFLINVSFTYTYHTKSGMMVSCVVSNVPGGFQHVFLKNLMCLFFFAQDQICDDGVLRRFKYPVRVSTFLFFLINVSVFFIQTKSGMTPSRGVRNV